VSLENPGANLDVEVRVDVAWGAGVRSAPYHRIFARTALLPSGATRRIPFMVPVRRDERALRVSVMSRAVGAPAFSGGVRTPSPGAGQRHPGNGGSRRSRRFPRRRPGVSYDELTVIVEKARDEQRARMKKKVAGRAGAGSIAAAADTFSTKSAVPAEVSCVFDRALARFSRRD